MRLNGRKRTYAPAIINPVKEEGVVMVEIMVDRNGKVKSAKALPSHPRSTSNNPSHIALAVRTAKNSKYEPKPNGEYELEKGLVPIRYDLN